MTADRAWSRAGGYRHLTSADILVTAPGPDDGRPWAERAGHGWLLSSGPGVVLYDPLHGIRRRLDAAAAFVVHRDDRLVYQVGGELVGLGPQPPESEDP